ncbi:MAG: hypothetical protein WCE73_09395 [Candidatus Angelobacter sp.]
MSADQENHEHLAISRWQLALCFSCLQLFQILTTVKAQAAPDPEDPLNAGPVLWPLGFWPKEKQFRSLNHTERVLLILPIHA